jgi:hypothetical protein
MEEKTDGEVPEWLGSSPGLSIFHLPYELNAPYEWVWWRSDQTARPAKSHLRLWASYYRAACGWAMPRASKSWKQSSTTGSAIAAAEAVPPTRRGPIDWELSKEPPRNQKQRAPPVLNQ